MYATPKFTSHLLHATALSTALFAFTAPAQAVVFINEFHYDNISGDTGEFIELAGAAGTDLSGWSLELYNGTNSVRAPYNTINLNGTFADQTSGFGFQTINLPTNGLQNGAPDGFALIDNTNAVVQFLSYEGTFQAIGGTATGLTSSDVGVAESNSTTAIGQSLQITGAGSEGNPFIWAPPQSETPGAANVNQSFEGTNGLVFVEDNGNGGGNGPDFVPIYDIQGSGLQSSLQGESVATSGIVTAVDSNGFYLQDATGDGDTDTSDALFVFTGGAPSVTKGDAIEIEGTVSEFFPGGADTGNLSTTQLSSTTITDVTSTGNALPDAVILGEGGRVPPNQEINTAGIEFFESVEAMVVTVPGGQVVDRPSFGEIAVVSDGGLNTTTLNDRGALLITPDDFNPERILIDDRLYDDVPEVSVGDTLSDVTGVVTYNFGNFKVLPDEAPTFTDGGLQPEMTDIAVGDERLTVASYNVLNLGAGNSGFDDQVAALAQDIVNGLKSPDVIGLQEIQDNTGNTNDGVTDASETYQGLIDAIEAAGGPRYEFLDVAPTDGADGGRPGSNIRPGFLYNPDRVSVEEDSFGRLPGADIDPAFDDSRKPIVATFNFNGEEVVVINNHFSSKGGSSPLYGTVQPPVNGSVDERNAQAAFVNAYVDQLLEDNPDANIMVIGDLNEFQFLEPLQILAGEGDDQVLFNLVDLLSLDDAYSFIFEGNAQLLDHILISSAMLAFFPEFDIVHLAAEFADGASDHEPLLSSFLFRDLVAVDAPATLGLLAFGLFGLAATRRRSARFV